MRSCPVDRVSRRGGGREAPRKVRIGSWNVGTLTGKFLELVDILRERRIDIACFQETKWKGRRSRSRNGYKLWYSGSKTARNVVRIIMSDRLKENVVEVKRCSDRLMLVKVVLEEEVANVVCAYAPQVGLGVDEKITFWKSIDDLVSGIPDDQPLYIGGISMAI